MALFCSLLYSFPFEINLRDVSDNIKNDDPRDYAVDLNATNFNSVRKDTPAAFAVVEFFDHWLVIIFGTKFQF